MKKILFTISFVIAITTASYSQASLTLSNLQNCDLNVELVEFDIGTCLPVLASVYPISPGNEFIYASITPSFNPSCFPPVNIETNGLGCTPATVTCTGPGFPTNATIGTGGPCGCSNPIIMDWDVCGSNGIEFL